uniref:40S ribosomal protein S15 n=1 Tax=Podarcis muralis TaxID=64176 RepID=A0A670JAX4_PODMU
MAEVEQKKKRTFRKFTYRCQLMQLYSARQCWRLKQYSRLKWLLKAKKEALPKEKPEVVKTHLMVSVYNGKTFNYWKSICRQISSVWGNVL